VEWEPRDNCNLQPYVTNQSVLQITIAMYIELGIVIHYKYSYKFSVSFLEPLNNNKSARKAKIV
jgi:hypothetical protein